MPGMRERADLIGGRLEVWSQVGIGTEVSLRVPETPRIGARCAERSASVSRQNRARPHERQDAIMTEPARIRVLTVDDHPLLREGLAAIINQQQDMVLVGEAFDGQEAVGLFLVLITPMSPSWICGCRISAAWKPRR